jgi:HAD superfamily hydrolase (TIGR01490 family)
MTSVAAIFDVDGTLTRTNAATYYLFFLRHLYSPARRLPRLLAFVLRVPYWLLLDRIDRGLFNRRFYRQYGGFPVKQAHELAEACFREVFVPRLIPEALHRAREHRARGDRILLVSGTLDFILAPLAAFLGAETVLCPSLLHQNGAYRGEIAGRNVVGPVKAEVVAEYAQSHGIDLSKSHAYADSLSDMSLLNQVGHAVVVNPAPRLLKTAEQRGWERILSTAPANHRSAFVGSQTGPSG